MKQRQRNDGVARRLWILGLLPWVAESVLAQYVPDYVPPAMLFPPHRAGKIRWSGIDFAPRASASVVFSDNLIPKSPQRMNDLIWSLSPGLAVSVGGPSEEGVKEVVLDYQPTFNLYTDHAQFNAVSHAASLRAVFPTGRTRISLEQGITSSMQAPLGATSYDRYTSYPGRLGIGYELSEKTALAGSAYLSGSQWDNARYVSYLDLGGEAWAYWKGLPRVTLGLGLAGGTILIENGDEQSYQRLQTGADYTYSDRVSLGITVGSERRTFAKAASARYGLIFSVRSTYRPADRTDILLDAYRRETPSLWYAEGNYVVTGASVAVRQQLWDKWAVTLSGGYNHLAFTTSGGVSSIDRSDNYFVIRPEVELRLTPNWRFKLFHQYHLNGSTQTYYQYDANIIGLEAAWQL